LVNEQKQPWMLHTKTCKNVKAIPEHNNTAIRKSINAKTVRSII
jgi:hypothetical protein